MWDINHQGDQQCRKLTVHSIFLKKENENFYTQTYLEQEHFLDFLCKTIVQTETLKLQV